MDKSKRSRFNKMVAILQDADLDELLRFRERLNSEIRWAEEEKSLKKH